MYTTLLYNGLNFDTDVLTNLGTPEKNLDKSSFDPFFKLEKTLLVYFKNKFDQMELRQITIDDIDRYKNLNTTPQPVFYCPSIKAYQRLTCGYWNKQWIPPVITPSNRDPLSDKTTVTLGASGSVLLAVLLSAWLAPIVSLVALPLIFFTGYSLLTIFNYHYTFERWPNRAELKNTFVTALDKSLAYLVATAVYGLFSSASFLIPFLLHSTSLATSAVGGPVITYLLAPLLIALSAGIGMAIYNGIKTAFTHYFTLNIGLSNHFPFLFEIHKKEAPGSFLTLLKSLAKTMTIEFIKGFSVGLMGSYLALIPGGIVVGLIASVLKSTLISFLINSLVLISSGLVSGTTLIKTTVRLLDNALDFKIEKTVNRTINKIKMALGFHETSHANEKVLLTTPAIELSEEMPKQPMTNLNSKRWSEAGIHNKQSLPDSLKVTPVIHYSSPFSALPVKKHTEESQENIQLSH